MMKYLTNIELVKNELEESPISSASSQPVSPVSGQVYRNTVDNHVYFYNGLAWVDITTDVVGNRGDIIRVKDDSYDSILWDDNYEVPTKNALRDIIEIVSSSGAVNYEEFILTGGQTDITLSYTYTFVLVFLGGILETESNYSLAGSTLTLSSPAVAGDLLKVVYIG